MSAVVHEGIAAACPDLVRLAHWILDGVLSRLLLARVHRTNITSDDLFVIQLLIILIFVLSCEDTPILMVNNR